MFNYTLIQTKRKTIAISIDDDLQVVVRAPIGISKASVNRVISEHEDWIIKHKSKRAEYIKAHPPLTEEEILVLKEKAKKILPNKIKYYSQIMNVQPSGIRITSAKKRFGSCSSKNSLCFSLYLLQYPNEAIDYVVVHELAHIRHHNHSEQFYQFVKSVLPDYKDCEKILKQ